MPAAHRHVLAAIRRWEAGGLVAPDLAERLRAEAARHGATERRSFAQLLVSATGAVVLLIATVTFFSWIWPVLGDGGRTVVAGGMGAALVAAGLVLERLPRWRLPALVLSMAGLVVMAAAAVYSENAWLPGTPGAMAVGVLCLAIPAVGIPLSAKRHPVLPVALSVIGFLYVFLFFYRGLGVPGDTAVWALDVLMVGALALLGLRVADGRAAAWELHTVAALVYVVPILLLATAAAPLGMGDETSVYPLDAWWVASTALVLWAVHRAPPRLRRDWYGDGLNVALPLGVGLAFWTTLGALELAPEAAALTVAALGGAGIAYAVRVEERVLLVLSALALVVAAWYYGAERAQALGGVGALVVTAGLLFWVAGRLGAMGRERS